MAFGAALSLYVNVVFGAKMVLLFVRSVVLSKSVFCVGDVAIFQFLQSHKSTRMMFHSGLSPREGLSLTIKISSSLQHSKYVMLTVSIAVWVTCLLCVGFFMFVCQMKKVTALYNVGSW